MQQYKVSAPSGPASASDGWIRVTRHHMTTTLLAASLTLFGDKIMFLLKISQLCSAADFNRILNYYSVLLY